jgi:hypothetical protein
VRLDGNQHLHDRSGEESRKNGVRERMVSGKRKNGEKEWCQERKNGVRNLSLVVPSAHSGFEPEFRDGV